MRLGMRPEANVKVHVMFEQQEKGQARHHTRSTVNRIARRTFSREAKGVSPDDGAEAKSRGTCPSHRHEFPAGAKIRGGQKTHERGADGAKSIYYFFEELPTGAKNTKEIEAPVLTEMSLAAHGPRLIDAFLKLKTDRLRGAVADLAQALARAG
jgi:hypothetical protein